MGDTLFFVWLAAFIFSLVVLFVSKLRFDKIYEKREERRRMLSYSKTQLSPTEDGQSRSLKIRRVQ